MRRVGGIAAIALAIAFAVATSRDAVGSSNSSDAAPARLLFFSGVDIWRDGRFSHGGLVLSPSGLDREGFTLKLMANGGLYRYQSGALGGMDVIGQELGGVILPGWRFIRDRTTIVAMAGLDVQQHQLLPDDPSAGLRGNYTGLATAFELWHVPKPGTMVAADGLFSTIGRSYSFRTAMGWRLLDRFYVGPEGQVFATGNTHRQFRLGLHVTGLRIRSSEWSAGFGWSTNNDARQSVYSRIGMLARH